MTQEEAIRRAVAEYGPAPYGLANLADCSCPDGEDSPGARMLASVLSSTLELVEYRAEDLADVEPVGHGWVDILDYNGGIHEVADGAPSVYTYTRWQEFVDLAAWEEDTSDLGDPMDDLTQSAGIALYLIAQRLSHAIIGELADTVSDAMEMADT